MIIAGAVAALTLSPLAVAAPSKDTDGDGMPNKFEMKYHLNAKVDDSAKDKDKDGLDNLGEFEAKTNPRKSDSDHDGVRDDNEDRDHDGVSNGVERHHGLHPGMRDSDHDGVEDGHSSAGSIVSFDGTTLVISKLDGTQLSGAVNASTEIECKQPEATRASRGHSGDDNEDVRSTTPASTTSKSGSGETENEGGKCTTAALVAGAPVHEAEVENGVFHSVHLNDD